MKVSTKILALMAAMAAGVAGAAGTTAGTNITNTATATYTDPSTSTTQTSTSNTVTTVVLPKPSFDISYADGKTDGSGVSGNPANNATTDTPEKATAAPGSTVITTYTVTNTGNVDLTINLTTQNQGGATSTVTSDSAGKNVITSITVAAGGTATIYTTTTIPTTAAPNSVSGSTPVGTVTGTGTANGQNGVVSGQTLNENQSTDNTGTPVATDHPAGTDLQYVAVTANNASITNNPDGSKDGGNTTTITTQVTPPGDTNPTPGYTDTTGTTPTPISIQGDKQIAYPPADTDKSNPDTVNFTNTVSNGAGTDDTVTLTPGKVGTDGKATDGNGVVWTKTGTGTWTDGTNTVQFLNGTTPTDTVTVPANGTANYTTKVTYPDSNPNAGTTNLDQPKPVTVIVTTTSGNNSNVSDTTTDIVYPAAATFGDTSQQKGSTGANVEDPSVAVGPNNTTGTAIPNTIPGATASFPMTISNTGQYPDTYALAGTVQIPLTDGTTATVNIVYKDANGNVITTTPTVAAGSTTTGITANVTVPANAKATGTGTAPTLQQTATGTNSKIVMTDNNDPLPIGAAGSIVVGKFTQTISGNPAAGAQYATGNPAAVSTTKPADGVTYVNNPKGYDGSAGANADTSYRPGVDYSYQIIAKNSYNSDVANFSLADSLNSNLNFVSATCTIFNKDGSTASTSTLAATDVKGNTVTCPDATLPQGGTANLTITVNIK